MSSFTYNENRIAASGTYYIDYVRFTVDDTVENDVTGATVFELSDEVITALYNTTPSDAAQTMRNYATAKLAAQYLITKYSKQVASFSSAGTSINFGDRAKAMRDLISRLDSLMDSETGSQSVIYANRPLGYDWWNNVTY